MATIEFTAFPRATEGRGASRRLRKSGRAPGVVYGGTNSYNLHYSDGTNAPNTLSIAWETPNGGSQDKPRRR